MYPLGGGNGVVGTFPGGGGGSVDVVFGGHPPLHEVTRIVDVVKEVEIYVVEFVTTLDVTGHVVNVV